MEFSKEDVRKFLYYEFRLGHSATEVTENIYHVIGYDVISKATSATWFDRFYNGSYSVENGPYPGKDVSKDLDLLKQMI